MPNITVASETESYAHYHADGTIWAKGELKGKNMEGYWEWFRKDGSKMRSGHFLNGKQTGEWITYDRKGKKVKTTVFRKQFK